ncbi:MAG: hypothetical protein HFI10_07585 [Lachnospiraceae bacterium]|nr:hypothetical protein [Lachnospiraceae bacterium]
MREGKEKNRQKIYTGKHAALRALLGGIGTGNISLDACGSFRDFEIFNHPDKGLKLPCYFFALRTKQEGRDADARILEAVPDKANRKPMYHAGELMGLPRFSESRFQCRYPFYEIELLEKDFPFRVKCRAYTPFIPLDADSSGMPYYEMRYEITNCSDEEAEVSVAGSVLNAAGFMEYDGFDRLEEKGRRINERRRADGLSGVFLHGEGIENSDITFGSMALAAPGEVSCKTHWQYGGWWDGAEEFWRDFLEDGVLEEAGEEKEQTRQERCVASLAVKQRIAPGETGVFTFYTAWHFPNRYGWHPDGHVTKEEEGEKEKRVFRNYYAVLWKDAWEVILDAHKRGEYLEEKSKAFSEALYGSTVGEDVLEALVSSITVLRSCTCFRIEDGTFFGWEGCFEKSGSCAGNCTHVWNYAQTAAFLFPELERDMRRTEFLTETDREGRMAFRAKRKLEGSPFEMYPAADGQLGCVMRVYREWKLSGKDDFLKELWQKVKKVMEYACRIWDQDGDGVMEAMQHNTYDIEFYGNTSMTNSVFYGALRAAAKMAEYLGEMETAKGWLLRAEKGSEKMERLLWNGEYYRQRISREEMEAYDYQYGDGCLSDQLFGQQLAHLYGLGYLFDKEHVKKAMSSIYRYNFKRSLKGQRSVQRCYAMAEEAGLVLCSWPRGGRPKQPFVYADEVWTGIEAQVAVHLIYEGMVQEALELVKAVRERYDGIVRSPFDEVECGYHYVRSMASWGLLIALSGYRCDMVKREISFSPAVSQDEFRCFYSNGESWGTYHQWRENGGIRWEVTPCFGNLEGVRVNGKPLPVNLDLRE